MKTSMTAVEIDDSPTFWTVAKSTMPMPTPANTAVGIDSILATTAAARANSSVPMPSEPSSGTDVTEAWKKMTIGAEQAGDAPRHGLDPLHRDAEQAGAVGVLGRGPEGDAEPGLLEEDLEAEGAGHHRDQGGDVVAGAVEDPLRVGEARSRRTASCRRSCRAAARRCPATSGCRG